MTSYTPGVLWTPDVFADRIRRWYAVSRRELPWRTPAGNGGFPDAYGVLVSEQMLQQTQVVTVVPYFRRWMERLPTIRHLAHADRQAVLRLWQGLGYYRRARHLHEAAKVIVRDHGGVVPDDVTTLRSLPGVGRYTAGAVASLAYGRRAPLVDGNVVRVLCRVDGITDDPRIPAVQRRLWDRAETLLPPASGLAVAEFNSALMELGATVCTPRNPKCLLCPVAEACGARGADAQHRIPPPKRSKPTPLSSRRVYVLPGTTPDGEVTYRIERRPPTGRWAGLWQFITRDADVRPPPGVTLVRTLGEVRHALSHRRYVFEVVLAEAVPDAFEVTPDGVWATFVGLDAYPMPKPHRTIAERLRGDSDWRAKAADRTS